jgi:hypothetical protein
LRQRSRARACTRLPDMHVNAAVCRTQSGMVITLRVKCIAATRAGPDVSSMLLNLRGHDLLLHACKRRFALCYRQSHAGRRGPLDHPRLMFDGTALRYSAESAALPGAAR